MLEYIMAFLVYIIITYIFEAVGINDGLWKYKNWKIAAGSMVWLAGTYIFMLGVVSLFSIMIPTISSVWWMIEFSILYCFIGVACDENMDVWEYLNIDKSFNFLLYLGRTMLGVFAFAISAMLAI